MPPVIESGRTLVPVRTITEALGADVYWNAADQTVTIVKNNDTLVLTIGSRRVTKNGMPLANLDVPALVSNGRTLVPLRFISENLGAAIQWDAPPERCFCSCQSERGTEIYRVFSGSVDCFYLAAAAIGITDGDKGKQETVAS